MVHDQPNNDVARANLGVMLIRLGEMALDQGGDAARARDEFGRAWKIQEEIALHRAAGITAKPITTGSFRASPSSRGPPS